MKILAVDAATKAGGAAVCEDGKILGCFTVNHNLTHSRTLLPVVDMLLGSLELELSDMDYIAVTVGPGSFTGIRIGVAAVKGLGLGANLGLIPVSSLEALAYNAASCPGIVCCCMDARRGQVYNALFDCAAGTPERLCPDRALSLDELACDLEKRDAPVLLVGDGAALAFDRLRDTVSCRMAGPNNIYLSAGGVAAAAWEQAQSCCFSPVSPDALTPVYLRVPQAERERRERLEKEGSTK